MQILTESTKEYEEISNIVKRNKTLKNSCIIKAPEDCIAITYWSIEDIRNRFPEGIEDSILEDALLSIQKCLQNRMMEIGWEVIWDLIPNQHI